MACVALTSLISTIEQEFLQPTPRIRLSLHDRAPIVSFFANLSSLKAFLPKKSSVAVEDLEIEIRDFALKAEDDIEIQLRIFLLAKDRECKDKASSELHQTLLEAAKNATEFLKILTREKDSCLSERVMASVALSNLMTKFEYYFLHHLPTVSLYSLDDERAMKFFSINLSSMQAFLQEESSGDGAAIKKLESKIRNFALKAEDDIEIQVSKFLLAKDTEHKEDASRELCQTFREAAEIAAQLLKIIKKEKEHDREREMARVALTSLGETIEEIMVSLHDKVEINSFLKKISSLQVYLREESSGGGGATTKDLNTNIRNFALKAQGDFQIEHALQETKSQEKVSRELHQALQEATENAAELLKIITKEREYHESATETASDALNIFMKKFHFDFLHPTPIVLLDDKTAMVSFFGKLSSLQDLLQKESSGGAGINVLEILIRYFVLKAEDDIETQIKNVIQAKDDIEYREKVSQLNQTLQEAAKNAEELLMIIKGRNNETQPSTSLLKHASKSVNVESDGSLPCYLNLEERMVGRHRDYRVIKDQLLSPRSQLKIISIVGMVGIGKTVLARNVYGDPSVASHFEVRGWITIPQYYNKSRMLCDLLQSLAPTEPNVFKKGRTPDELEMQVHKCLFGRRYLIVLDNIWSNQAWTDITQCVPSDKFGSCILLTTSHFKEEYYGRDYIHNMALLDPKESWDLFCNILPIKDHMAPKFEKIRSHVVEKCDGLPQLIVEVAKRLSKCNNIQQGWKKIEKELESLGILDRSALTVNYNLLPHHLKVCFLYFGVFPKRKKIVVKMLIRLWIAEGFLKPLEHMELESQAYGYLQELIDRSLLLIENRSFDGKIKTCRTHSALHSFCVGKAQEQGILCAVNTQQHSGLSLDAFTNSCRWLSVCSHSFDYYVLFGTNIPRSIFFFHEYPKMFVPPKLLRVLAFDRFVFLQKVPLHLGDLVFLRYLSVTRWFEGLDLVVSNNPNLQTLVVSGNGAPTVHLPSSIWKPPHLRHLKLGNSYTVDPPSMVKENLQSLSCVVRFFHYRRKVYDYLPNIKKLKIFLKDDIEASHTHGSCSDSIILDYLFCLYLLEELSISVLVGCTMVITASLFRRNFDEISSRRSRPDAKCVRHAIPVQDRSQYK